MLVASFKLQFLFERLEGYYMLARTRYSDSMSPFEWELKPVASINL